MLSIIVIHISDRVEYLKRSLELWGECDGYNACQKILAVDGTCSWKPPGFEVIEVRRPNNRFSLGECLNVAVERCVFPKFLYLDDDRIIPTNYLHSLESKLRDKTVVYPSHLAWVDGSVEAIRRSRENPHSGRLLLDPRTEDPRIIRRKTPMSGCMGMMRDNYLRLTTDAVFDGYGYPDYDLFMKCTLQGYHFVKIPAMELHQQHPPIAPKRVLKLMSFYNAVMYMEKYHLNLTDPQIVGFAQEVGMSIQTARESPTLREFLSLIHPKLL